MQIVSDLKIASILMFIGSILFLIGVLLSLPQSREDRAFEAKTVQVTMDLIHSIFVYVGSTGFLYLSFTDNGW